MRILSFRSDFSKAVRCSLLMLAVGLFQHSAVAQATDPQSPPPDSQPAAQTANQPLPMAPQPQLPFGGAKHQLDREEHSEVTLAKIPRNILWDGGHIAISPLYLRPGDLKWLLPVAGATVAAFATDTHTMNEVVSRNPSFNDANGTVSDGLRDGFIAVPIILAGAGMAGHNYHTKETGLLGSEAVFDAFVVDEFVKICSFRERPFVDKGRGNFYIGSSGGVDSSFVSGHSMISWASATVIADESHSKWVKAGAYTAATGVSLTRVLSQQHFPTDVLLGAAGGWLIGHYVFRAHHHRELPVDTH